MDRFSIFFSFVLPFEKFFTFFAQSVKRVQMKTSAGEFEVISSPYVLYRTYTVCRGGKEETRIRATRPRAGASDAGPAGPGVAKKKHSRAAHTGVPFAVTLRNFWTLYGVRAPVTVPPPSPLTSVDSTELIGAHAMHISSQHRMMDK